LTRNSFINSAPSRLSTNDSARFTTPAAQCPIKSATMAI
jgi:hypothetical protein